MMPCIQGTRARNVSRRLCVCGDVQLRYCWAAFSGQFSAWLRPFDASHNQFICVHLPAPDERHWLTY